MITVCHIVNLITGTTDGVYSHLKMIFKNSDKTKFQHILIFQGGEKVEKELTQLGVKVYISESLKNKISVKSFIDIYKILKEKKVDIIHTHLIKPYAISGLVNIFLKKKFIFNYNGIFLDNNPYYNFVERSIYWVIHHIIYLFGKVDLVLVPSKRSKELLMNETKLFPEPIVYYNGYTQSSNSQQESSILNRIQNVKESGKIIAMVARLEIQKRIDKALTLFKFVLQHKSNAYLLIFGDGEQKQNLLEKVKELGLNSNVIFFDFVESVISYYHHFELLLFTSDYEGMPLSLWEAMAIGIPVVAPDVGGFKEIIEENDCGFIYRLDDYKDAEDKIIKILDDPMLKEKFGANGKRAIEIKYNEDNFIRDIEQTYLNLLTR